jgi:hypothetical protein
MTPEERTALDRARTIELSAERFGRRLGRVLAQIERRLRDRLDGLAVGAGGIERGAVATVLRQEARRAVREAGWPELVSEAFGRVLDQLVIDVLSGATRTASVAVRLEALRTVALESLLGQGDLLADAIWRAVARGLFTGRPVRLLLQDIAQVTDRSRAQIETLYDTSVAVFGRQVEALTAEPGDETPFKYLGPDDEVVRPFCEARLGKVFTRGEIDRMDNGQIPDVFLTAGGYNCRHSWIEVSRFASP